MPRAMSVVFRHAETVVGPESVAVRYHQTPVSVPGQVMLMRWAVETAYADPSAIDAGGMTVSG